MRKIVNSTGLHSTTITSAMPTENHPGITEKDAAAELSQFMFAGTSATALGALLCRALNPKNASDNVWAGLLGGMRSREEEVAKDIAAFALDEDNTDPSWDMRQRINGLVDIADLAAAEKTVALARFKQSFGSERWLAWQSEELWWGPGSIAESSQRDAHLWSVEKRRASFARGALGQFGKFLTECLGSNAPLEFRMFGRADWKSLIEREKEKEELVIFIGPRIEIESRIGWLPTTLNEFFSDELLGRMAEQKDTAFRLTAKAHALIEAEILRRASRASQETNAETASSLDHPERPVIRL